MHVKRHSIGWPAFGDGVAIALLLAFSLYYGLLCFYRGWGGDIYVYVAGISEVYRNFPNLMHEATLQPADDSIVFTPYLFVVSAIGWAANITPYNILQYSGLVNVAIFVFSVLYFFSSFLSINSAIRASALFIIICTVVRGSNYNWSSELSLQTLAGIQAYPSFLAWSLALVSFSFANEYLAKGRVFYLFGIAFIVWFVLLSHNLTGSWIIIILVLQFLLGFYTSWRESALLIRRPLVGVLAICCAFVAALFWPYSSPFSTTGMPGIQENAPFAGRLLKSFPLLYLLSIPALVLGTRLVARLTLFAFAGFFATVAAYLVLRHVSDYFERYVFFAAFFPQVVLAGALASVIDEETYSRIDQKTRKLARYVIGGGAVVLVVSAAVLVVTATKRDFSPLRLELQARENFEKRLETLTRVIHEGDILAACPLAIHEGDILADCPLTHDTLHLFSTTGARFVIASSSYKGRDRSSRVRDVDSLFRLETSPNEVDRILLSYGITKLLIGDGCLMAKSLQDRVSDQMVAEGCWRVYAVR